jgi:hypothetical protein
MNERIPGINFNNKRVQIIAAYEEYLRHGFIVRSSRLLNEMNTFVYVNGRPDHQKGQHDDLIMSIAMACYVGEFSFTSLTKVTEQAKVMMQSWTISENENVSKSINHNTFIPAQFMSNNHPKEITRNDYQQYGWLFGKPR